MVTFVIDPGDLCQALTEREVELKKQMKEQEVKLKATAPDEKQLAALRKTVAANKKGTTPWMLSPFCFSQQSLCFEGISAGGNVLIKKLY